MAVHGAFTYGLPGETQEQMNDTRRFIASLPFDSVQESGTAVIEGTPLDSLLKRSHLEKYECAVADGGYKIESDGQKKMESLSKTKQTPGRKVTER